MTGNATVDTAIEAVKDGALDYLSKPFDFDRLRTLLPRCQGRAAPPRAPARGRRGGGAPRRLPRHASAGAPRCSSCLRRSERLAPHVRTVLVTGETGTGKELVAKALHKAGPRRDRKFVTVNCSAVVETLFESELFGHVRGAFTGATETKVGSVRARRRRHAVSRRSGRAAAGGAGQSCCAPSNTARFSGWARSTRRRPTSA